MNDAKFKDYHMRCNELLSVHKRKKKDDVQSGPRTIWATTNFVLMFLENSILKHTRKPIFTDDPIVPSAWEPESEVYKPKLMQWVAMKQMLLQILDHRLEHAEEIDSNVNNTYMTMDEHLIIYLLQKHQTRPSTELALIDFLSSLKYYLDAWPRAKMYAQMLGFL
jgi:hypothetical protein